MKKRNAKMAARRALNEQNKQRSAAIPSTPVNTELNVQNRKVLAQHYRAKYGVK